MYVASWLIVDIAIFIIIVIQHVITVDAEIFVVI